MERPALAQELGREDQVGRAVPLPHLRGKADRHGGLDDHQRSRVGGHHSLDHRLDRRGVEIVGLRVIVGGGGDDHVIGASVGLGCVKRALQTERAVREEVADLRIVDRRLAGVDLRHLGRDDVEGHHIVPLREQHGDGEADIAGADDGDLEALALRHAVTPGEWGARTNAPRRDFNTSRRRADDGCRAGQRP